MDTLVIPHVPWIHYHYFNTFNLTLYLSFINCTHPTLKLIIFFLYVTFLLDTLMTLPWDPMSSTIWILSFNETLCLSFIYLNKLFLISLIRLSFSFQCIFLFDTLVTPCPIDLISLLQYLQSDNLLIIYILNKPYSEANTFSCILQFYWTP